VANGAPDLVELARGRRWEIAPANDEDGVAQVIEGLLGSPAASAAESSTQVPLM
jgi:hydroxymethylpyrimidine pyrophosphatase-like HAD family hydrolase